MQDQNSIEIFRSGYPNPVIIDINDYHYWTNRNWNIHPHNNVLSSRTGMNGKKTAILARDILGVLDDTTGRVVDHINRNPLDNRRCNLRLVSRSINSRNSRKSKGKTSKFKNVSFSASRTSYKKWQASIKWHEKTYGLGFYETELEAAEAFNNFIIKNNLQNKWPMNDLINGGIL